MNDVPDLKGEIHSAVRFRDPRFMFLVDDKNFYKIDTQTNVAKTYFNQNCIGLYFSDNNYLYTMCHKAGTPGKPNYRQSGFRLYDIANVIEKDQDNSYLLTSI
jgi:hypothetical protein